MLDDRLIVPESEINIREFNEEDGIIGMMDCSGSTLVALNKAWPGILKMIVSSRPDGEECKAKEKSELLGIPYAMFDALKFEKENFIPGMNYYKALQLAGRPTNTYSENEAVLKLANDAILRREKACSLLLKEIYSVMDANGISKNIPALGAGFMLLTSPKMNKAIYTLTNHPGDLTQNSIVGTKRTDRSIVGDGHIPSLKAIMARHKTLYASNFRTGDAMDNGSVVMTGYPLESCVDYIDAKIDMRDPIARELVGSAAQNALKYLGDQQIGPAAFYDLFKGNIGRHEKSGILAYKFKNEWYLVPSGISIDVHKANNPNSDFCLFQNEIQMHNDDYKERLEVIAKEFPKKY